MSAHACHPQGPYKTLEDLWDEPQPDQRALRQQVLGRYTNLDKPQPTAQLSSGERHQTHGVTLCYTVFMAYTCAAGLSGSSICLLATA